MIVLAGTGRACRSDVAALTETLGSLGIDTTYIGRERDAGRIAAMAVQHDADSVEICMAGSGGVHLLRELIGIGRCDVSIVIDRIS